jgi:pimeloyl-ACP methyl ester carboxylesterase
VRIQDVLADGVTVRMREWGDENAPPLVFWPGLNPSAHVQLEEVGRQLADDNGLWVLAISPPGWELPPLESSAYRPSLLAGMIVRTLDGLAIERAAFCGHSWGASIGCHLAVRHPERLSALVLLDAGYTNFQDRPDFEDESLEELTKRLRDSAPVFESWNDYLKSARSRTRAWRPALEARTRAGMREREGKIVARVPPEAVAAALHGVGQEPPRDVLALDAEPRCPTLLVVASESLEQEWAAQALEDFRARVPSAEVMELDSGHDLLADAPKETTRVVGEWLRLAAS